MRREKAEWRRRHLAGSAGLTVKVRNSSPHESAAVTVPS